MILAECIYAAIIYFSSCIIINDDEERITQGVVQNCLKVSVRKFDKNDIAIPRTNL
jgi:hypothetical protein